MVTATIKSTKRGWYRLASSTLTGSIDFKTGEVIRDQHGCTQQNVWVGPYDTAEDAVRATL